MKLYIKHMVTIRCKMVVKSELEKLGLSYKSVELGEAQLDEDITAEDLTKLEAGLLRFGLKIISNSNSLLIEKIKAVVIELVHYAEEPVTINFSDNLSTKLGYSYKYLSNIFSDVMGVTIEHYFIAHKIERVKELLVYDELNLSEISYQMNYSSPADLSTQFKKVTGLLPSHFKKLKSKRNDAKPHKPIGEVTECIADLPI